MTFPLFIVTGISGSGKSATSLELQKLMVDFNVFDIDLIVNNDDYLTACDNWLKVAYYSAYSGRNSVLFGKVPDPYNVEICDHFPFFNPVITCIFIVTVKLVHNDYRLVANGRLTALII
ncbi:hypothetical protein ABG775_10545 [Peribacillus simplex]|uniref:hypothetical protein n=1 Tax=Peribacillus TaxID=2675229 RepID=UPI001781F3C4|nr:hypothetical protein [Brevibacillus sp. JNUCC-41]QOS88866.1 hypothetical protein JNUCC41_18980 [Brevibacillus sp. JNUCC-41]